MLCTYSIIARPSISPLNALVAPRPPQPVLQHLKEEESEEEKKARGSSSSSSTSNSLNTKVFPSSPIPLITTTLTLPSPTNEEATFAGLELEEDGVLCEGESDEQDKEADNFYPDEVSSRARLSGAFTLTVPTLESASSKDLLRISRLRRKSLQTLGHGQLESPTLPRYSTNSQYLARNSSDLSSFGPASDGATSYAPFALNGVTRSDLLVLETSVTRRMVDLQQGVKEQILGLSDKIVALERQVSLLADHLAAKEQRNDARPSAFWPSDLAPLQASARLQPPLLLPRQPISSQVRPSRRPAPLSPLPSLKRSVQSVWPVSGSGLPTSEYPQTTGPP
ncbi:unnamed protein product, partial [Protopolystoma xenopodis]